ncbi:ABC transporter ATP-binding protein [Microvirga sp. STS02]|uniref:ABC transporter ATP-binding protein n=1 Tax=Hymenobacter negativus TaxID=2795026 RepID=UPI0018DC4A3F|nr:MULTISPECIES: ABC transporter ATP-binding protein [Bacteria]MBH8567588.1 ABC transporter ATP-binding protein [Hymenobacter negativus]MBR7207320.1 ABC transporter ATP-binding protein [Microvirga sp. STS02]
MKILYSYLRNYWPLLVLALGLAAINQVFSLLDPYFFRQLVDHFTAKYPDISGVRLVQFWPFFWEAIPLVGIMLGVAMVSRIAKNFQDYYVNVITQRLGAKMYSDGLRHSLELPYQVFEDQRSGETLGKLQKVRIDVEKLIQAFVNVVFTALVGITFVMWYAITVYWPIALGYFLTIPLLGILSFFLSKRIKVIQKTIVAETTALAGSTTESLRNIELIKSLGLAQQETERLNGTTAKILKLELRKVRYLRSLSFVQGTFVNLLRNIIIMLLLYLRVQNHISLGEFFSFFIYSFSIFGPLQELGSIIGVYRETEISLGNFQTILDTPKDVKPVHPKSVAHIDNLAFDHVSFQHLTAKGQALTNISFGVKLGETIAFVGPSGSGKTTLVKLLVGLYPPLAGEIRYNGIPGSEIDLDELREQIGFVTQDTQLFAGTIRENLRFVAPNATDEECLLALRQAAADTLLARAPLGLDTVIGEGGVKVSGGEKQRLSIARALLRKPTLMVFDEATSALDSLTEEEIGKTVRELSGSRQHMTILIAHRLSTILHADRIFVLERGHIAEQGGHAELLAQKGLYYAMWRQQIGERKEAEATSAVVV